MPEAILVMAVAFPLLLAGAIGKSAVSSRISRLKAEVGGQLDAGDLYFERFMGPQAGPSQLTHFLLISTFRITVVSTVLGIASSLVFMSAYALDFIPGARDHFWIRDLVYIVGSGISLTATFLVLRIARHALGIATMAQSFGATAVPAPAPNLLGVLEDTAGRAPQLDRR